MAAYLSLLSPGWWAHYCTNPRFIRGRGAHFVNLRSEDPHVSFSYCGREAHSSNGRTGGPSISKLLESTSVKLGSHPIMRSARRLPKQPSPHRGRYRRAHHRHSDRTQIGLKFNYLGLFPETQCSMIAPDSHQSCSHTVPHTPKDRSGGVLRSICGQVLAGQPRRASGAENS